jgi:hypothetical protein
VIGASANSRKAAPDPQTLAADLAEARKIYKNELEKASKAQKAAQAKIILQAGTNTSSDQNSRYVLIDLAREVFIQAGEVAAALDAARKLESEYEVNPAESLPMTIIALDRPETGPDQRGALAKAAADAADEMLADLDFEQADKLSAIAVRSAGAARSANRQADADLKRDIGLRRTQVIRAVKEWELVKPSYTSLATAPNDPAANAKIGRFFCLNLEDWTRGLAHLIVGDDPRLAAAAKLDDQGGKGNAEASYDAADAWLKLAADTKAVDRDERLALQRRAKALLQSAVSSLPEGLKKIQADKWIKELKDIDVAAARRPSPTRSKANVMNGLIGRVVVGNRDAGIVVTYQPGYTITAEDVAKLAAAAGVTANDAWRVELGGVLLLPAETLVEVWHAGGSSSGGIHRLYVLPTNQPPPQQPPPTSQVGDDRLKEDTRTINLQAGLHAVRWSLSGGDLGTAAMRMTPVGIDGRAISNGPTIQYTRDMSAIARSAPTKNEFNFGK